MVPFLNAAETSKYKETVTQNIESPSQATSLPTWVYKELVSIQKEVSVIDANGATKESVQALKERIGKVEVQLEQSQLRVDETLKIQGDRIVDMQVYSEHSLTRISWETTWFGIIAGVLGIIITAVSIFFSYKSKKEAVESAQKEAQNQVERWIQEKEKEINKKFDEQNEDHEKQFSDIRDQAELQAADSDINEAYALADNKNINEALLKINRVIKNHQSRVPDKFQKIVAKSLYYKGLIYEIGGQYQN